MISDTIAISPMAIKKFLMAFCFMFTCITQGALENYADKK